MYVINARNVNEAYPRGMSLLLNRGEKQASRYGDTLEFPTPVCTVYRYPTERVLLDPDRDCNPFFHLFESLWMLGGRNDVAFPAHYAKKMREFSDNGETFHGAYGFRWRKHFDMEGGGDECVPDQLATVIDMLKRDPDTRRAVLTMWDPVADLGRKGNDFPCNTQIYFKIRDSKLNMTVCNRSNDMIWGAYGANAVHLSVLLEYVACKVGVQVGEYRQVSDSFHAYTEVFNKHISSITGFVACDYELGNVRPYPLYAQEAAFDTDLEVFLAQYRFPGVLHFHSQFFSRVVEPLRRAWEYHLTKSYSHALQSVEKCQASDWKKACTEWLQRRKEKNDGKTRG